ncbi:MAG: FHA domain-containing protein [Clostridiales bacterium]|nr:FHA domain-containing protein [Clostridiales bacterium]
MYSGYEFPIQSGEIVTFGTDPQFCQIVLESSSIEGRYCTVSYNNQKGNYTVVDYSSAGVYLEDGDRIAGNVSVLLDGKTNIYLGDRSNGFRLG